MLKLLAVLSLLLPAHALIVKVDYRFDTKGFFDRPGAKDALEAAAARWSRIIDQTLLPVEIKDEPRSDIRFSLFHPATGKLVQVSAAASAASDVVVEFGQPPADFYFGEFTLEQDVWVLFAGGRDLPILPSGEQLVGSGGPLGLGINVSQLENDPKSLVNRGFNKGIDSLKVLGGAVVFDTESSWNFDFYDPTSGGLDFYTFALHEIGHALGLNCSSCPEWRALASSGKYVGPLALEAYNADNEESISGLEIQNLSLKQYHWSDDQYQSAIFTLGSPNIYGTVPEGDLQDLLMDPFIDVTNVIRRLEVTNVEVGALRDIGWSVINEDPPEGPEIPLVFERSESGGIKLGFLAEEGATYSIQTSTNGINWLNVRPFLVGTGSNLNWEDGQKGFTDPYGAAIDLEGKFYRIRKN